MSLQPAIPWTTGYGINQPRHSSRQNQGLHQAMVAKGRTFIGTAYSNRNDGSEQNIIRNRNEIGSITPENAMKWGSLQPNRGQFNWGQADQVAQYAQQNGKFLRCHALVVCELLLLSTALTSGIITLRLLQAMVVDSTTVSRSAAQLGRERTMEQSIIDPGHDHAYHYRYEPLQREM